MFIHGDPLISKSKITNVKFLISSFEFLNCEHRNTKIKLHIAFSISDVQITGSKFQMSFHFLAGCWVFKSNLQYSTTEYHIT